MQRHPTKTISTQTHMHTQKKSKINIKGSSPDHDSTVKCESPSCMKRSTPEPKHQERQYKSSNGALLLVTMHTVISLTRPCQLMPTSNRLMIATCAAGWESAPLKECCKRRNVVTLEAGERLDVWWVD